MKYLKKYKLFENVNSLDIFKDIASIGYIIEDAGYKIVYYVTAYRNGSSLKSDQYTYARGSSNNILAAATLDNNREIPLEDKLSRIFMEIVDDLPKKKYWEVVGQEIRESGLLEEYVSKLKANFPEYNITFTKDNSSPTYVFVNLE